jgi:D-methionine transport system substrate-binding protein
MTTYTLTRRRFAGAALALAFVLGPVGGALANETIKLGVIGGDEERIWEVAKKVAAKDGLDIELVSFSDYAIPNEALEKGDLDANAFQHKPYLDSQIAARGYKIVPIGYTLVAPIAFYSKKVKAFADLPEGATIGIPNDPSNGGRALKLLEANGLIKVKADKGLLPTVLDVTDNPKNVQFKEIDAAQIPNLLPDLDGAVINTNYALGAGLSPRTDALVQESRTGNPYGNFIAVREADKNKPVFRKLVTAYQNPEVADFINANFKGAIQPAW